MSEKPSNNAESFNLYSYLVVSENGIAGDVGVEKKLQNTDQSVRKSTIELIAPLETELDLTRANEYLARFGIEPTKSFVIPESLVEVAQKIRAFSNDDVVGARGVYNSALDLVLVYKPDTESAEGDIQAEATYVHENVHARKAMKIAVLDPERRYHRNRPGARRGFTVRSQTGETRGAFFEEGLAGKLAGDYIASAPECDGSVYFSENYAHLSNHSVDFYLPKKYLREINGRLMPTVPDVMGYGIELLGEALPGLEQQMVDASKSAEGLRNFYQRIDSIQPGLSRKLMKVEHTAKGSVEGLGMIVEAIYGSWEQFAEKRVTSSKELSLLREKS